MVHVNVLIYSDGFQLIDLLPHSLFPACLVHHHLSKTHDRAHIRENVRIPNYHGHKLISPCKKFRCFEKGAPPEPDNSGKPCQKTRQKARQVQPILMRGGNLLVVFDEYRNMKVAKHDNF